MKRLIVTAIVGAVLLLAVFATTAVAGPPSPPSFGNYNPLNLPNEPLESWGVEKIVPQLGTYGEGPESSDSIHIITDPLADPNNSSAVGGWVTFWCQSTVGFHYNIGATDLEPNSTYTVHASGSVHLSLGTIHTDANGRGSASGVKTLAPGGYYVVVSVKDSQDNTVLDSHADGQGFLVF
jgi:hypothetical protein